MPCSDIERRERHCAAGWRMPRDVRHEARALELFFEWPGHDVLAVRELVLLFDATRDVQVTVGVDVTEVAGSQAPRSRLRVSSSGRLW